MYAVFANLYLHCGLAFLPVLLAKGIYRIAEYADRWAVLMIPVVTRSFVLLVRQIKLHGKCVRGLLHTIGNVLRGMQLDEGSSSP